MDPTTELDFEGLKTKSGRYDGHLFVFVDRKKVLVETDRVRFVASPQRPGETAFVWAKVKDDAWRYLGVGRHVDGEWAIPPVDFATWRQWGEGRDVSRRLPDEARAAAEKIVAALVSEPGVLLLGPIFAYGMGRVGELGVALYLAGIGWAYWKALPHFDAAVAANPDVQRITRALAEEDAKPAN